MTLAVEVKFSENGRVYYFDATDFPHLKKGDNVIVDFDDSNEFAVVISKPKDLHLCPKKELKTVIRVANEKDLEINQKWKKKAVEARPLVEASVKKFGLEMKLVDITYNFSGSKLLVVYTADERVDFRELVRELASIFKTRIELRQIGLRDEAKMCGGCGPCGQPLCCSRFLSDYTQVSIKMAKTQGLALNPNKINGVCGKLMCCLAYEFDDYQKIQNKMPKLGSVVLCPLGEGEVVFHDLLKEEVCLKFETADGFKTQNFKLSEIENKKQSA